MSSRDTTPAARLSDPVSARRRFGLLALRGRRRSAAYFERNAASINPRYFGDASAPHPGFGFPAAHDRFMLASRRAFAFSRPAARFNAEWWSDRAMRLPLDPVGSHRVRPAEQMEAPVIDVHREIGAFPLESVFKKARALASLARLVGDGVELAQLDRDLRRLRRAPSDHPPRGIAPREIFAEPSGLLDAGIVTFSTSARGELLGVDAGDSSPRGGRRRTA